MALEESIINGIVTFGVLGASIWVYLHLEKRKYMQQRKIDVYSAMITALKNWFISLSANKPDSQQNGIQPIKTEKETLPKVFELSEDILFYGSSKIHRRIFRLFKPTETGSRINAFELKTLIIDMIKEIDSKRDIEPDDIYFYDKLGFVIFAKPKP